MVTLRQQLVNHLDGIEFQCSNCRNFNAVDCFPRVGDSFSKGESLGTEKPLNPRKLEE